MQNFPPPPLIQVYTKIRGVLNDTLSRILKCVQVFFYDILPNNSCPQRILNFNFCEPILKVVQHKAIFKITLNEFNWGVCFYIKKYLLKTKATSISCEVLWNCKKGFWKNKLIWKRRSKKKKKLTRMKNHETFHNIFNVFIFKVGMSFVT